MIESDEQLQITCEQLGRMYSALADLRKEVRPINPRKCDVFAEGFVDQLRELRAEVEVYLGLKEEPLRDSPQPGIENDQQLLGTHEALVHLYRVLASLRKEILPLNPRNYATFAEGPTEEIHKLHAEVDAYLGLIEPAKVGEAAGVLREDPPPKP